MQPWESSELEDVRREHLEFAREHLEGDFAERDREGDFSRERWKRAADFGVLGLCMPKSYGGQGRPVTHAVAAIEGLGYGCQDNGFVYALTSQLFGIQMPLHLLASDGLKQRYLPDLIQGKRLAAHAFTEERAGSDALSIEVRAAKAEGGFRLHGTKRYITNAPHADVALVFVRTDEGRSPFALTAVMVDLGWRGVEKGRTFEKAGLRTVHMGELHFQDVSVPADHVVNGVGRGLRVLGETTGWERAVLFSAALGPMARAVDEAIVRVREREQFGKPVGAFQQVSARVADMVMRQRMARLTVYDLASRLDATGSAQPLAQETALAKLFVSEAYVQLNLDALQVAGVRGYLMDSPVQQRLRDSLSATIYAGTSEIMRNIIAKLAGLPVGS